MSQDSKQIVNSKKTRNTKKERTEQNREYEVNQSSKQIHKKQARQVKVKVK